MFVLLGRSQVQHSNSSVKHEIGSRVSESSLDNSGGGGGGTPAGRRVFDDWTLRRAGRLRRSASCSTSQPVHNISASNSTVLSRSATNKDKREEVEDEKGQKRHLSSGEAISTGLTRDHMDGITGRRDRRAHRHVNISTQTLPTVDEVDDTGTADSGETVPGASVREVERGVARASEEDLDNDELQSCVDDIVRLVLSPAAAADCQQARGLRYSRPHHHGHHYQHLHQSQFQQQPGLPRRVEDHNRNQHNRHHPAHSHPSSCSSCNMHQADFKDPVLIRSVRDTGAVVQQRFSDPVRSRPSWVTAGRSPAPQMTTSFVSPSTLGHPADTDARSDRSACSSCHRLTAEALRRRLERLLVEIKPRNDDGSGRESKIVAALRQAIVDST